MTFTPEWAAEHGIDEVAAAAWRAEPRSKVAFDIEDAGHGVVNCDRTRVRQKLELGDVFV